MKTVIAFIIGLGMTGALASDGAALYQKCASCHGDKGQTAAMNKSSVITGADKASLVADLKGYREGTLDKNGMGKLMHLHAKALSDGDIEALASHISGF